MEAFIHIDQYQHSNIGSISTKMSLCEWHWCQENSVNACVHPEKHAHESGKTISWVSWIDCLGSKADISWQWVTLVAINEQSHYFLFSHLFSIFAFSDIKWHLMEPVRAPVLRFAFWSYCLAAGRLAVSFPSWRPQPFNQSSTYSKLPIGRLWTKCGHCRCAGRECVGQKVE